MKMSRDIATDSTTYYSIEDNLKSMLSTGEGKGNERVEFYRKDFREDLKFYTKGYLDYLYIAYIHDIGIEIAPWYLWNVMLHQIAQIVKNSGDKFRNIFTSKSEKITIYMDRDDIDISIFASSVKEMMPDPNTYDKFFPQ